MEARSALEIQEEFGDRAARAVPLPRQDAEEPAGSTDVEPAEKSGITAASSEKAAE